MIRCFLACYLTSAHWLNYRRRKVSFSWRVREKFGLYVHILVRISGSVKQVRGRDPIPLYSAQRCLNSSASTATAFYHSTHCMQACYELRQFCLSVRLSHSKRMSSHHFFHHLISPLIHFSPLRNSGGVTLNWGFK